MMLFSTYTSQQKPGCPSGDLDKAFATEQAKRAARETEERLAARRARLAYACSAFAAPDWWTQWA